MEQSSTESSRTSWRKEVTPLAAAPARSPYMATLSLMNSTRGSNSITGAAAPASMILHMHACLAAYVRIFCLADKCMQVTEDACIPPWNECLASAEVAVRSGVRPGSEYNVVSHVLKPPRAAGPFGSCNVR